MHKRAPRFSECSFAGYWRTGKKIGEIEVWGRARGGGYIRRDAPPVEAWPLSPCTFTITQFPGSVNTYCPKNGTVTVKYVILDSEGQVLQGWGITHGVGQF